MGLSFRKSITVLALGFCWCGCMVGSAFAGTIYFAQVADGGGYITTITLLNVGNVAVSGTLRLYNQGGAPRIMTFNGVTDSQFSLSLSPRGVQRIRSSGSNPTVSVGWASFESSSNDMRGIATFDFRGANGILTTTAGVIATGLMKQFVLPVEVSATSDTGIAIAAPAATTVVRLRLLNEAGTEIATILDRRLNSLARFAHVADLVTSFFPNVPSPFVGSVIAEAEGGDVAATGLTLKESLLSAIPVTDVGPTSAPAPAPLVTTTSPASAAQGTSILFHVNGSNFQSTSTIAFGGTGITVTGYVTRTSTLISANLLIGVGAQPGSRTLTVTNPDQQQAAVPNAFTVTLATSGSAFNKAQSERLIATWTFNYTITTPLTDVVTLRGPAEDSTEAPGTWFVFGENTTTGREAAGAYDQDLEGFLVLVLGSGDVADAYIFDFSGANSVSGCHYFFNLSTSAVGSCHALSGSRPASAVSSSLTRLDSSDTVRRRIEDLRQAMRGTKNRNRRRN